MPHLPHPRTLAIAGLAAAAFGTAAAPAQAVQKTLAVTCNFPMGPLPLQLDLDAQFPITPSPAPGDRISVRATLTDQINPEDGTSVWRNFQFLRAASLEGRAQLDLSVGGAGSAGLPVSVDLTIEKYVLPATEQPLVIPAAGGSPAITFPQTGQFAVTVDDFDMRLRAYRPDGSLIPRTPPPPIEVPEPEPYLYTLDVPCSIDAGQDRNLFPVVSVPPTPPGAPTYDSSTQTLRWTAATDDRGIAGYDVFSGDRKIGSTDGSTTSFRPSGGDVNYGTYTFSVVARDTDGNATRGPATTVTLSPGMAPPSVPTSPQAAQVTSTSATLKWGPSIANVGSVVSHYEILRNGVEIARTARADTTLVVKDLTPATAYCLTVVAVADGGGRSKPSEEVCFTTLRSGGQEIPYGYDLAGAATLKTLTKGTLPLKGSITAKLQVNTGAVSADLALAPTKARLTTLGFLPVTASVAFVTNGKTTGTLDDAGLKTRSSVRIKLPQVTLLGIPLAGGTTCQTRSLSTIDLASPDFDPITGGTLKGTFAISDLSGCGILNGIVSPLTAGTGNAISIKLTPAAPATT